MNIWKRTLKRVNDDENGLASFVIVGVLVILLTLISIGFAKIMDRAQNNSLNYQLSSAANYAAQSALSDTSNAVLTAINSNPPKPVPSSNTCKPTDQALLDVYNSGSSLSGPELPNVAKYTCIMVDPTPASLDYEHRLAEQSTIIKMLPSQPQSIGQVMFGWQSDEQTGNTQFPKPAIDRTNLYDEKSWNQKLFNPLLRVTLYHVDGAQNYGQGPTYFLYPQEQNGSVTLVHYDSTADGSLLPVRCGSNKPVPPPSFNGSVDYNCDAVIDNMPAYSYWYARVTPIYVRAKIGVKANYNDAAHTVVKFSGEQANIDVTAKDGTAVKRLQGKLLLDAGTGISSGSTSSIQPGNHDIPEYGLQSANTICKRFVIQTSGGNTYVAPTASGQACANTNSSIEKPPNPTVSLSPNPANVNVGGQSIISWTVTAPAPLSGCSRSSLPSVGSQWDNANAGTALTGQLPVTFSKTGAYTFTMSCTDILGRSASDSKTVNVTTSTPGTTQCSDGVDNDGDGLTDMNDPGCSNPSDNDESNPPPVSGTTQCSDGVDNDGDGLVDSADPDCHSDGNPGNPGSYTPGDNSESSSSTGTGGTGGAGGIINVYPNCADNSEPGCAWYNNAPGSSLQQCHDGLHDFVICVSWYATDSFSGAALTNCKANGGNYYQDLQKGIGYNGSGPYVAGPNNWWNVTFGFVTQPSGTYRVNITCFDNQGHSGSSYIDTCFDGSCLAGGGGGGNNGGGGGTSGGGSPPPPVPCSGWSTGYIPNCTCLYGGTSTSGLDCPPPPPVGGCALNVPGKSLYLPDYAIAIIGPFFGALPPGC